MKKIKNKKYQLQAKNLNSINKYLSIASKESKNPTKNNQLPPNYAVFYMTRHTLKISWEPMRIKLI